MPKFDFRAEERPLPKTLPQRFTRLDIHRTFRDLNIELGIVDVRATVHRFKLVLKRDKILKTILASRKFEVLTSFERY